MCNFYVSINVSFTQANTRGDDTTLIKPSGSSNTSLYFSVFVLFVFGVDGQHSHAGAQEMTTRRDGGGERYWKQHGGEPEEATKRFRSGSHCKEKAFPFGRRSVVKRVTKGED